MVADFDMLIFRFSDIFKQISQATASATYTVGQTGFFDDSWTNINITLSTNQIIRAGVNLHYITLFNNVDNYAIRYLTTLEGNNSYITNVDKTGAYVTYKKDDAKQ